MSMYLFDEQPILANKTLARELGLNEALVLQQINYWIEINKKAGNNYHDCKYWTYNSIRAWQENDFDYMSIDTVKRTFSKLEKSGYLLSSNYNKDPRDKTKWYTINDENLNELYRHIEDRKKENERKILEAKDSNSMPNALEQNAPMEECKMHPCNNADCTDALDENPPMQSGCLPQALPNNSTKNTSDISSKTSFHLSIKGEDENYFMDGMNDGQIKKSYKSCLEELRESCGYNEHMGLGNKFIAERYDEIIKVLADIMILDPNDMVTINQTKIPAYIVQERFRELNSSHMEFIADALKENEYKIRNIRAFILTASYNAPSNMDAYYTALVSYNMREGGY